MADRGYIRLYRGWRNSDVFKDEPCSEREAWVWLLEEAAYKPRHRDVNGVTVTLRRGQAALSSRFLARAWRWEEPRVRRFLKRLQQHGMIAIERTRPVNVLSVANYDAYQAGGKGRDTDAPSDAPSDAGSDAGSDAPGAAETQATQSPADAGSDAGSDAPSDAPTDANEKEGPINNAGKEECPDGHSPARGDAGDVVQMPDRPSPKRTAEQMADIWNETCGDIMRRVGKLTDKRQRMANARFQDDLGGDMEAWRAVCQRARASPFLRGEAGNWPGADFEWCIRPNNLPKIMEGKYDPKPSRQSGHPQHSGNKAFAAFMRNRAGAEGG